MVQVVAVVKPFRASAVIEALGDVPIVGGTVREAMGYGRQKHRLRHYLGSEYDASFVPKVELRFFVDREHLEAALRIVTATARTGRIGDGKVFVLPCIDEHATW